MKYKVAVLQLDSIEDKTDNMNRIRTLIMEAKSKGVKLISLPEVMNCMSKDKTIDNSERLDGYSISFLKNCAIEFGLWIHCGSITEKNSEGLPYNTTVMLSPEGKSIAEYRKLHLFDVDIPGGVKYLESARINKGNKIVDVKTDIGHLGFTICYDLRFPELFRILSLRGAQVIFVPSNFAGHTGAAHWQSLLRARAIENGCYIIAAAQTGVKSKFTAFGHSLVVDSWGKIVAQAEEGECMIIAEIDLHMPATIREQLGSLQNRRDDIYSLA